MRDLQPRLLIAAFLITSALSMVAPASTAVAQDAEGSLYETCIDGRCEPVPDTGNRGAVVSVIIMSDFECPFCQRAMKTMEALGGLYGTKVHFSFLQNPLSSHENAFNAALASMAAARHGAFWAMHDRLFATPGTLSPQGLKGHATQVGIAPSLFQQHIEDPFLAAVIRRQAAIAAATDAKGTPTFFINGKIIKGAVSIEDFKAVINDELANANGKAGYPWLRERLRQTNPTLADYLVLQKIPTSQQPKPSTNVGPKAQISPVWRVTVDPEIDATRGPRDAPVTIVTFTDFECPFCGRLTSTLEALQQADPDGLRLVFKHHPLSFHKRARPASIAAICAKQQGKFWEMHDLLFEDQRALGDQDLLAHAKALKLKIKPFKRCLRSGEPKRQILADQALAASVNAKGTPTSFVNGKRLNGAVPKAKFEAAIKAAREDALALKDVRPTEVYDALVKGGRVHSELDDTVHPLNLVNAARKGPFDAPIQVTVASDFQCPYCARVDPILKALMAEFEDQISITFKHLPLSFHDAARPAAEASECAHAQGKFWEYHDVLFANQVMLDAFPWEELATKVGLTPTTFQACVATRQFAEKVEADREEMSAIGVRGTPTFFINGRVFKPQGGWQAERFIQVIKQEILGQ